MVFVPLKLARLMVYLILGTLHTIHNSLFCQVGQHLRDEKDKTGLKKVKKKQIIVVIQGIADL